MAINLNGIGNGFNRSVIDSNFQKIEDELNNNVLRRGNVAGNEDNAMREDLDMNSQRILNLPKPENPYEPARLIDLSNIIGTINLIPNASDVEFDGDVDYIADNVELALELEAALRANIDDNLQLLEGNVQTNNGQIVQLDTDVTRLQNEMVVVQQRSLNNLSSVSSLSSSKANRDQDAVVDNIAVFDSSGNPVDSGLSVSDVVDSVTTFVQEDEPTGQIVNGTLWFIPSEGTTYIWYEDGDSGQWVEQSTIGLTGLERTIISYATTLDMENSSPEFEGQRAENQELGNAQYVLAPLGYVSQAGDITAANGRVWELQVNGSANARNFESIQEADDKSNVMVPSGSYSQPTTLNFGSDSAFFSDTAKASIGFQSLGAGFPVAIGFGDNFKAENINFSFDASGENVIGSAIKDGLTFSNVVFDGGTTDDGVTKDRTVHFIQSPTGDIFNEGLTLSNYEITGVTFGILKDNTALSQQERIKVSFGYCHDNYAVPILFNSPATGSSMNDILSIGNSFKDNLGPSVGGFGHFMSCAGHVDNFRIIANYAGGSGYEIWRAEEGAANGVVSLNTAEIGDRHGIEIIGSNVGGVDRTPERLAITSNALKGKGLAGTRGIHCVFDGSGIDPLYSSVVSGNILSNWESGIRTGDGSNSNVIMGNVVKDSGVGIQARKPNLGAKDNVLVDCTSGVDADAPGAFGEVHFRSDTDDKPYIANPSSGLEAAICNWTWESNIFSIPSGTSTVPIMPLGGMMVGRITAFLFSPSQGYELSVFDVDWDGATLSLTTVREKSSGGVLIAGTQATDANSDFNIQLFNSLGSAAEGRLQLKFEGVQLFV